jgi:gamma-glutamyltranspeptidase/glutathione hydrolase
MSLPTPRVAVVPLLLAACAPAVEPGRDAQGATGAVTAGHPLAAQAGLDVLRDGGNAMDAAITMAAMLAVARPHMNGLGGDAFILYYDAASDRVYALNGSGRSGSRATPTRLRAAAGDVDEMPEIGPTSVSVPGAVGAWAAALERFGTITFAEALAPAAELAHGGLVVSEQLSADIAAERDKLLADSVAARIFLRNGNPPEPGTLLAFHELGATLDRLRQRGPREMYTGETGRAIARYVADLGGFLTPGDLAAYQPEWVAPISGAYRGLTVYAMPPNTQGVMLLELLGLLERFDLATIEHNSPDYLHVVAQAVRLAARDRDTSVADPAAMRVGVEQLLDPARLERLASRIEPGGIAPPNAERDDAGTDQPNTVALMAVDAAGNVVSMIQSLFHAFGSGLVVPGMGIVLHNRGSLFSLDATHPNVLAPRKQPYHTLCPALALRDGRPWLAFGTPGGDGQTHTLSQVLNNILVFGMTPQEAIDAPRMRWYPARLSIEDRVPEAVRSALAARGYQVRSRGGWTAEFGGAQAIRIGQDGAMHRAGADRRREGWALAY